MSVVKGEVKGDTLVLTIDISKAARDAAPMSSTNKGRLLATTHGFARFEDINVSLNATIPRRDSDPAVIEKPKAKVA